MSGRLEGRVALIVGGGQIPGATIGNGRATAITFAREGALLAIADKDMASAEDTMGMVADEGGAAIAIEGNVIKEADCARFIDETVKRYGRIDILQNNVGVSTGDGGPVAITVEAWRNLMDINLTGMLLTAKHVLPVMQKQHSGVITNISSMLSVTSDVSVKGSAFDDETGQIGYKVSKTGVNSLTESLAMSQAPYGIRVNAILPGLMETPTAIEMLMAETGASRESLNRVRDSQVPLGGKQGTAWDVAKAALFLASDDARFITGALLPVDGGQSLRRG